MQEFDAISEAFSSLMFYHYFFSAFLALPFILNLIALFTYKNFAALNKKIWYSMPLLFFLLGVAFLGGISLLAFSHTLPSLKVWIMLMYTLFVFGAELYRIRSLKIARTSEARMLEYIKMAKILYFLDLMGFILVFWGSKSAI